MLIAGSLDLAGVMKSLASRRPVFHSEADFQLALAREIQNHDPAIEVYLESRPTDVAHLDIACEKDGFYTAIELKYLTRTWSDEVLGQRYNLKAGARDYGRYDVVKDLSRVEQFVGLKPISNGAVVVLSNDPAFWEPATSSSAMDSSFRIHQGAVLEAVRDWARPQRNAERQSPIALRHRYVLSWSDFSTLGRAALMRQLVVEVQPSASKTPR